MANKDFIVNPVTVGCLRGVLGVRLDGPGVFILFRTLSLLSYFISYFIMETSRTILFHVSMKKNQCTVFLAIISKWQNWCLFSLIFLMAINCFCMN